MKIYQIEWGSSDYQQALALRDQVLRIPLGMSIYNDPLENEKNDLHIVVKDQQQVIGVCYYRKINQETMQMKQVAISPIYQHQHIGKTMFNESKKILVDLGVKNIIVHARESALGFYKKLGFKEYGEPFLEIGICHHLLKYSL